MGGLRIIAGELKGRRIRVPRGDAVRPTADRVREALFSILGERTSGARVLDLYSGSGALGLEAISRGAREAVFCESGPAALETLRSNIDALGVGERCLVVAGRVLDSLDRALPRGPFDLALADPPYAAGEAGLLVGRFARSGLLAEDGWLVIERSRETEPATDPRLDGFRTARYGGTSLDFYRMAP